MNKYGLEHFYFIIIEEVSNDSLNEREKFWIKFYNSLSPNGYNLTTGGEGALGRKSRFKGVPRPQEVKDKIKKLGLKKEENIIQICLKERIIQIIENSHPWKQKIKLEM